MDNSHLKIKRVYAIVVRQEMCGNKYCDCNCNNQNIALT